MKNRVVIITCASIVLISMVALENASAYWVWTPETKKFVNPKYAVKDSPKEQFDYAMNFYQAKDYQKAAQEFEKLTKQYEYSEYASKAQYYVGLCYENMNKLYFAFQNYQKAIDNFPHIENMEEIIAREFNIANIYEEKTSPKVLGTDIMTSTDRAVEIYRKVVDNAPFGRLADESQFRMGQAFKKAERYDEAIPAFQKILDDYPNSQFIDKAKFEVADCAYRASLKPAYDIESTDKAIKAFEDFGQANKDEKLSQEAAKTIQRLKDKSAEKSLVTAQFYESQRHYESAIIYYKDVVTRFPDSSLAVKAKAKIEQLENKGNKIVQGDTRKEGEKKEKSVGASAPKPEKPKGWWNPFKFTNKPKEAKAVQPTEGSAKKNGWAPLSFTKKEKPSEPVTVKEETKAQVAETEPVKETPVQADATPQTTETAEAKTETAAPSVQEASVPIPETKIPKKEWTPLKFTKPEKKEKSVGASAPKPEKPKGWWNPFKFTNKPKEAKAVQPTEGSAKKNGWAPLSFTKKEKPSEPVTVKKETKSPKKEWTPLKFTKPVKKGKPANKPKEAKAVQPTEGSAKKNGWAPLSFTKKEKPPEPVTVKEETKARVAETEPVKETPVQADATPQTTETAEAKPAEEDARAAVARETVAAQETIIIQGDIVIRKDSPMQETSAGAAAQTNKIDQ